MKLSLEQYMAINYNTIVLQEETTDGSMCYRAEHPQLPGCMSHGDTEDEALKNLVEAKRLYIESLLDEGLEVPKPIILSKGTFAYYKSSVSIITPSFEMGSEIDMPPIISVRNNELPEKTVSPSMSI